MKILILLILFTSCKNIIKEKKDTLNNAIVNDIKKNGSSFNFLENKKIVGLSVKNMKETDIQKRYWIDFYSNCMCDSPSFFIDKEKEKIYIFNYCTKDIPPISKEKFYTYTISKIAAIDDRVEIIGINDKQIEIRLTFEKVNSKIYKLHTYKDIPTSFIGSKINEYFTVEPHFFQEESCGNFDG